LLKLDPSTDSISFLPTIFTGTNKWNGGVLSTQGIIYGVPDTSASILRIDPSTDAVTLLAKPVPPILPSNNRYAGGALGSDGRIYMAPTSS
jgi:hypothetical protein